LPPYVCGGPTGPGSGRGLSCALKAKGENQGEIISFLIGGVFGKRHNVVLPIPCCFPATYSAQRLARLLGWCPCGWGAACDKSRQDKDNIKDGTMPTFHESASNKAGGKSRKDNEETKDAESAPFREDARPRPSGAHGAPANWSRFRNFLKSGCQNSPGTKKMESWRC
jgi:hypothetical protein